jgi:hypothetical protein
VSGLWVLLRITQKLSPLSSFLLAKQPFLSPSFPYKILPDVIRFSFLWTSQLYFYWARSSALRPALNLDDQVPVFKSPRNRAAQLYPQPPDSLFIAFYDLQGYGGGILTRLHMGSNAKIQRDLKLLSGFPWPTILKPETTKENCLRNMEVQLNQSRHRCGEDSVTLLYYISSFILLFPVWKL